MNEEGSGGGGALEARDLEAIRQQRLKAFAEFGGTIPNTIQNNTNNNKNETEK